MSPAAALVVAVLAAGGASIGAPTATEQELEARAYCELARSVAESERALLVAPDLVGSFGWLHESERVFGQRTGDTLRPRATVGLRYSLGELWRGLLTSDEAAARCHHYGLASALRRLSVEGLAAVARRAHEDKARVLRAGMPEAEAILHRVEAALRDRGATAAELTATQLRLDALRGELVSSEEVLARTPSGPAPAGIGRLVERLGSAEEDVERAGARLRQSRAWDLSLQGGYDYVHGIEQRVPWYALATATFDLGHLWQRSADARAVSARRAWAALEANGVQERAGAALREVRAALEADRIREAQTAVLLRDLESRHAAVRQIQSEPVVRYREFLWFELLKLRAEHAYLQAQVRELGLMVEPGARPGGTGGGR